VPFDKGVNFINGCGLNEFDGDQDLIIIEIFNIEFFIMARVQGCVCAFLYNNKLWRDFFCRVG
jgi:hypothetical protein